MRGPNSTWARTVAAIDFEAKRKPCSHSTHSNMKVNGVLLACCEGGAITCKRETIAGLLHLLKDQCDFADIQRFKIERNAEKIRELEARISELKDALLTASSVAPPVQSVVNNHNTYVYNQLTVNNIGDVMAPRALEMARCSLGGDLYGNAISYLKSLPPSGGRDELLRLANSPQPDDVLNFQREVINTVSDSVKTSQISPQEKQVLTNAVESENKRIEAVAAANNIPVEPDDPAPAQEPSQKRLRSE